MAGTRHPRPAPLGPPPGRCPGQDRRPGVGSPGAVSKASVSVSRDPGPPSSPNTALGVDAPHGTANSAPAGCAVVVSSAWQGRGQGDPGAGIGWPEAGLRAGIASGPLPATTPSAAAPRTHRALLPPRGRQRHHMEPLPRPGARAGGAEGVSSTTWGCCPGPAWGPELGPVSGRFWIPFSPHTL